MCAHSTYSAAFAAGPCLLPPVLRAQRPQRHPHHPQFPFPIHGVAFSLSPVHVVSESDGSKCTLINWLRRQANRQYGDRVVGRTCWIRWCSDGGFGCVSVGKVMQGCACLGGELAVGCYRLAGCQAARFPYGDSVYRYGYGCAPAGATGSIASLVCCRHMLTTHMHVHLPCRTAGEFYSATILSFNVDTGKHKVGAVHCRNSTVRHGWIRVTISLCLYGTCGSITHQVTLRNQSLGMYVFRRVGTLALAHAFDK